MYNSFGIIYKVTNKINGKIYIGQTIQLLSKRRNGHLSAAKCYKYNSAFHNAIRKYNESNFIWEILDFCGSKEELDEMEFHYIKQFNSYEHGYNLTLGGEGTVGYRHTDSTKTKSSIRMLGENNHNYGKTLSKYTRLKLSEANKGKKHSEEAKQKISRVKSGVPLSEQHKLSLSIAKSGKNHPMYGKLHTEETKQKIAHSLFGTSNPMYGKNHSVAAKHKMSLNHDYTYGKDHIRSKKYVITDPSGNVFMVNGLNNFCTKQDGVLVSGLGAVARGKRNHHKGYKCRHYDEKIDFDIPEWKE